MQIGSEMQGGGRGPSSNDTPLSKSWFQISLKEKKPGILGEVADSEAGAVKYKMSWNILPYQKIRKYSKNDGTLQKSKGTIWKGFH